MKIIKTIEFSHGKCVIYGWISLPNESKKEDPTLKIKMIKCVNNELIDNNCPHAEIIKLAPELTELVNFHGVSIFGTRKFFYEDAWYLYSTSQSEIEHRSNDLSKLMFIYKEECESIFKLDKMNREEFDNYLLINIVPQIKIKVQDLINKYDLHIAKEVI
jgi:hypothetical protein